MFGDQVELVANFGQQAFAYHGTTVPGQSILAKWLTSSKTLIHTPAAAAAHRSRPR